MRTRFLVAGVLLGLMAMLGAIVVVVPDKASAVVGSGFDAGNIISDEVFFNRTAMNVVEIQSFLDAKVGTCQNTLCLNVYRVDTPSVSAETYCSAYQGAAGESAATIIFKVQQACGISAKVILVTLQKEQGLATRTAPTDGILRKAMGMGCPDTSVCDAQYYGFFNQVYAAARQLNRYNNGSFTYIKVGQYNNVLWHPNASACGSSPVLIKNKATAALYYYTPYQPNAAALANLGGTGNACSSYGNRNFWVYFSDWFGSTQSEVGGNSIRAVYSASGGASGPLGAATSELIPMSYHGGGFGQAFQNGSIYWSPSTGAHIVSGTVLPYYFAKSGAAGPLAWPNSPASVITDNGGGTGQSFQNGSVYASPTAGTWSVRGTIRSEYWKTGGSAGPLGWPTNDASAISANGGGSSQEFQTGTILSQTGRSTYATSGSIRDRYLALTGPAGVLSWPQSPILSVAQNGSGQGQQFAGGSVYSSASNGTWEVRGPIRDFYFSKNGAAGELGWPTAAPECSVDNTSCSQSFQAATVAWTSAGGARVVSVGIDAEFARLGGVSGTLGKPISDVLVISQNGGGLGRAFEFGSIYEKKSGEAFTTSGALRSAYFSRGGAAGGLGWPLARIDCSRGGGSCMQQFEKGWLYATPSGATWESAPEIDAVYLALNGQNGALGSATSGVVQIPQNGAGVGQAFSGGSIYWSAAAGGYAVTGSIRQFYFTLGGSAGSLGWPIAPAECLTSDSSCFQDFQTGRILISAQGESRVGLAAIEDLHSTLSADLGNRTSSLITIPDNGGGFGQAYGRGSIYSSIAGTYAVSGAIRSSYFAQGGAAGNLAWPTSAADCGTGGSCSQAFQGGTIVWSEESGGNIQ
ncbi:hypothetical protein [Cryobacterium sp. N19]|uniref:hypothetical protein n=1 Tax=Cryobacterium sp. N19 TaxID=2048288 RepID=UPI000CE2CE33|nr:hypothetical protein [Cryobacterium sp. N19]